MLCRIIMIIRIILIIMIQSIIINNCIFIHHSYFYVWKDCLHSVTDRPTNGPTDIILYRVSIDTNKDEASFQNWQGQPP